MIWFAIGLGVLGLALSAFFSGSETGFYRATRVRLVLDAMGGDRVSRSLAWLANHPTLFIATTLTGNNLANYLASLAIVMGAHAIFSRESPAAELAAPLVLAPLLFVYGELMPKSLFLAAPNRLLRRAGPLFLLFFVLFLPISALLWGLNWLLTRLAAESPEEIRATVARRELHRALDEGHASGILLPSQRELARAIFAVAKERVGNHVLPAGTIAVARADMSKEQVRRLAEQSRLAAVPVEEAAGGGRLAGYVRTIDLDLDPSERLGPVRPLLTISSTATLLDAAMQMHTGAESLAQVVDAAGRLLGLLTAERLHELLLGSQP